MTREAKVALFGVPTAAGAPCAGLEEAPRALREAGLLRELRARGLTVVHLSDLSMFPFRADDDHPKARNAATVGCAVRAARDETTRALAEGFTVVLGGDCTITAGVVAGARDHLRAPVGLVYVDANADLNTEETTPSGLLSGMALAVCLGRGPAEVVEAAGETAVLPDHVALIGIRALDAGERRAIGDLGLVLPASAAHRLGMRTAAALALDGVANGDGPLVVHLDVDAVDPAEMTAKDTLTPGTGLTLAEVSDLVTALLASPRVVALVVTEYAPHRDPGSLHARRIVDLLVRAVLRRLSPPIGPNRVQR